MDFIDDCLKGVLGDRYDDGETAVQKPAAEQKKPPLAQYEAVEANEEDGFDIWGAVKFPLLFVALVAFLGWTANMELVHPIVAIPGMCLCSACFGWSVKRGVK